MDNTEKVIEEILDVVNNKSSVTRAELTGIKYNPSIGSATEFREMLLLNAAKCIISLRNLPEIVNPNQTKLELR